MSDATGIDDVEWLDKSVVQLSDVNRDLRDVLGMLAALMQADIDAGIITNTEIRKRYLAEARKLLGK